MRCVWCSEAVCIARLGHGGRPQSLPVCPPGASHARASTKPAACLDSHLPILRLLLTDSKHYSISAVHCVHFIGGYKKTRARGSDKRHILDLIMSNEPFRYIKFLAPLGKSYHSVLNMIFYCNMQTRKVNDVFKYNYAKSDYNYLRLSCKVNWEEILTAKQTFFSAQLSCMQHFTFCRTLFSTSTCKTRRRSESTYIQQD